jgi:hypothetical protein
VDGGPIGTLLASLVLSLEVLVSLLGGAASVVLGGLGYLSPRRRRAGAMGGGAYPLPDLIATKAAPRRAGRGLTGVLGFVFVMFVVGLLATGLLLFVTMGVSHS